jgi:DNA-binding NarL/FixJ family response regulator
VRSRIECVLEEALDANAEPRLRLSPRESEVLEGAALGLTNMEIATRLNVTVHAVKFHLGSVYRKLGVANRTEAVVTFLRAGQVNGDKTTTDRS